MGILKLITILILIPATTLAAPTKLQARPLRVVIDPGHGGSDLGAVYDDGRSRITEKEISLALAQEAARELKLQGFWVTLTRTTDEEIPLASRTALANRVGADVFLSIHTNSTENPTATAEGVETFILDNASDASSRRLAYTERHNEPTDVSLILKDLRLDANISDSKRLACAIQQNMVSATAKHRDRGIKQSLFYVLLGADMPSALVEAGFLSNPKDRALLLNPHTRRDMGVAIARAMEDFRRAKTTAYMRFALNKCKVH